MALYVEVVAEDLSYRRNHVSPNFGNDKRFKQAWWNPDGGKSPVSYCRFIDDDEEVGRAKVIPRSRSYPGYTTWHPPTADLAEIELIEIRPDLRRSHKGYGRHAVEAIRRKYGDPVIAMSLDETSDPFWERIGWTAHTHPDDDYARVLFSSA